VLSPSRRTRLLLRLYPPAWRARYGNELEELIEQEPATLSTALDVARAAARERLRAAGLAGEGIEPGERERSGTLLVLWAWVLFVLAGLALQKGSEHWTAGTRAHDRALAGAAFGILEIAAAIGSVLVLGAICAALPRLAALLRRGGWSQIRRPIVRSCVATVLAAVAIGGLVQVADGLDVRQRNGHDLAYSAAFVACALLVALSLACWAVAATAVARRLERPRRARRLEARAAAGVTTAMVVTTVAAVVWWASLPRSASMAGSPLLLAEMLLMAGSTALGTIGTRRALGG
jgi:hypothetical protein